MKPTTTTSTSGGKAWVELDEARDEHPDHPQSRRRAWASRRPALCFGAATLCCLFVIGASLRRGRGGPGALGGIFDARYRPGGWDADDDDDDDDNPVVKLKNELHLLTPEEAKRRFGSLSSDERVHRAIARRPKQSKIDHFVVLYMENHAADHFFGCMDLPGFDGIKGGHTIPKDPSDPSKGDVKVTCGDADYVCTSGPGYATFDGKFPSGGQPHIYPYSPQDDKYSAAHGASATGSTAVKMFSPEQVPIKAAIAEHFGVFNKLYTAVPSASSPNHLFTQSATSCGMQHNGLYNDCLGPSVTFPQMTIYDSLRAHNRSFGLFMNSTCGLDGLPCHGEDPHNPDSASAINTPDVAMAGVARHKDRFYSQTVFYERARNGTLDALSWILPPQQACDHPCHDVAKGERLLKDVYEAVRNGPGWGKTLLFVAYDDAGGYYDHAVPPYEGVPADDAPCHLTGPDTDPPYKCPGGGEAFDFRRLGLRSTAMLISPWVRKGAVFQTPKGPTPTSQFELSSVPATIKNLFNLSFFLTKRDEWAGSFDELLLDTPRTDAPYHLPEAPEPASPWTPPPPDAATAAAHPPRAATPGDGNHEEEEEEDDDDQRRRRSLAATAVGAQGQIAAAGADAQPIAQHCSTIHGAPEEAPCAGHTKPNLKQRRNLRLMAELTGVAAPDIDQMTFSEADRWIASRWREWMAIGAPLK